MTAIPGTAMPTVKGEAKTPNTDSIPANTESDFKVLTNNRESTNQQIAPEIDVVTASKEIWFMTQRGWVYIGFAIGALFALIGIFYRQFFVLAFFCPIIASLAWHAREFAAKHEHRVDPFHKQKKITL